VEQGVDERRLAVVDVGHDGDVSAERLAIDELPRRGDVDQYLIIGISISGYRDTDYRARTRILRVRR
jgi:hypothetical protein